LSDLHLHPLAATLRWQLPTPLSAASWEDILSQYVAALAQECETADQVVIGHIKGLALLPDGGFIRASAVSAAHPVDTEVRAGDDVAQQALTVTLNVIVYGLSFDAARKIAIKNAQRLIEARGGSLVIEAVTKEGAHTHDHDQ
jgi:hypothetical protein